MIEKQIDLTINTMSRSRYVQLSSQGLLEEDELYLVEDPSEYALSADIGDGKVTVNQGGVKKGEFTLNQKGDVTIDLSAGGGEAVWGGITGNIADQSDLKTALDRKSTGSIIIWS